MTQKKQKGGKVIFAGLAGLTAAAVGAYYLYGHREAKKHRAQVKGWMLKAKGEVLEELEKAGNVTESVYNGAVDTVAKRYNELKNVDIRELESFIMEMRDHWGGIKRTMGTSGKRSIAPFKKSKAKSTKKKSAK